MLYGVGWLWYNKSIHIWRIAMKLWYDRKSKDPMYFVQVGIRNGKKVTTKNIERIGKHSELIKQGYDDPLAYAKEYVDKLNKNIKEEKLDIKLTVDLSEKIKNNGNDVSKSLIKNTGYLYIKSIYDKLGLYEFFDEITKNRKITYNANLINMFLSITRILDPGSKLYNYNSLSYFYGLDNAFTYQHIQRFLSLLADNYDSYIETLFNNSNNIITRDTSVCYFDCTNFYFEKEEEDDDYYDEVTGELISGLLKYGVSKEHRPNPIVQMGLFMDGDGIPLTMCINPGNQNESLCAVPCEEKMLKMFKNKSIIYCSDGGLGYTNTRVFNSFSNRKFIVSQSIKKLSDKYKEAVFNDFDYKYLDNDKKASLEFMKTFDKNNPDNLKYYNTKIYKSFIADSVVDLGLEEYKETSTGKLKKVKSKGTLKQRIIITYDRKMAEYQKAIRERQIERARQYLSKGDLDSLKKNPNDFKRFIKKLDKSEYKLDENKINEESKYDGFYALATNIFNESVKDILKVSSRRYKIEESFRIMKTNFDGRPIYHYKENKIKAHFLTCFTALLIYRLIEVKLDKTNHHFSTGQIVDTLKNINVLSIEDAYYQATYTGSNCLSSIEELFPLKLDKKYYLTKDLNKKLKNILK